MGATIEDRLLQSALDYAARGWPVFPVWSVVKGKCACGDPKCENPGKHPIGKLAPHGRNSATTNKAVITQWWKDYPLANVAVVTGEESKLVVLDIDERHGGFDSLKKLVRKGNMPYTPLVGTGGGGEHHYMAWPGNGTKIRSRARVAELDGIDVRAAGGYVLAPPSLHVSGKRYTWQIGMLGTTVAKIPNWLLEVLKDKTGPQHTTIKAGDSYWEKIWGGVPDGQRNQMVGKLAGRLLAKGLQPEEVLAILRVWNLQNEPPLEDKTIDEYVKNLTRSEEAKPEKGAIVGADWLLAQPTQEMDMIMGQGLLVVDGNMIITGESEAGKSLLSLQLAIHLSKGISFFGFDIPTAKRVLIIQKENPMSSVQARIKRIAEGSQVKTLSNLFLVENSFKANLNNERDRRRIKERIEKVRADIVILDPLSSYHTVNENDNTQMRATLDHLTDISREMNCAWIVVHHEGKPGEQNRAHRWRFRGASSIRDWADTMIGLLVKEDEQRILRTLSFDKIRHGPRQRAMILERNKRYWTYEMSEEGSKVPMSAVAEALAMLGGWCKGKNPLVQKLIEITSCARKTAYRAIDSCMNKVIEERGENLFLIGKF